MRNARFLLAALVFACGACTSLGTYVRPACSGIFTSVPCLPTESVPVTMDAAVVRGCDFKGFVESHDGDASWSEAENELRGQAVNRGGNVVLILSQAGAGDLHEHSAGEAYACAGPASTPAAGSYVAAEMHNRLPNYCPHFPFMD